jgi:hypothetical protein
MTRKPEKKNKGEETIMKGLYHVYEPLVTDYDSKVRDVQIAQASLALQLDELLQDLSQITSNHIQLLEIKPWTEKVLKSKKKIQAIGETTSKIQERLKKLNKKISTQYPEMNTMFNFFSIKLEEVMKREDEVEELPFFLYGLFETFDDLCTYL